MKNEGILRAVEPENAKYYPAAFQDPEKYWYGFAARARVIIVNTDLVPESEIPNSIYDLLDEKWKSKISIAKPLFGTTATQVACLFQKLGTEKAKEYYQKLKANLVKVEGGNKNVAVNVAKGITAMGLTDTDDAIIELENGAPVKIIFPDSADDQLGTLFIPNTVSLIKNSKNIKNAELLLNFLLSKECEKRLALSASSQIPLHQDLRNFEIKIGNTSHYKAMEVDFNKSAELFNKSAHFIANEFLK